MASFPAFQDPYTLSDGKTGDPLQVDEKIFLLDDECLMRMAMR